MSKNEFALAFNEVLEEKQLSKEIILGAIESAMVSAYRRAVNASTAQHVEAKIDPDTGRVMVFAEKEVVEDVQEPKTEVLLEEDHFRPRLVDAVAAAEVAHQGEGGVQLLGLGLEGEVGELLRGRDDMERPGMQLVVERIAQRVGGEGEAEIVGHAEAFLGCGI